MGLPRLRGNVDYSKVIMAEPLNPKEVVSIEELAISNMYEIEALSKVLVRKGL